MCLCDPRVRNRWLIDKRSHLAKTKINRRRTQCEILTLVKEERRQRQIEEDGAICAGNSSRSSSSTMHVSLEYLASGEKQDRPEPILVQKTRHIDDDIPIPALEVYYEIDGRKSRYIKEVLDWY